MAPCQQDARINVLPQIPVESPSIYLAPLATPQSTAHACWVSVFPWPLKPSPWCCRVRAFRPRNAEDRTPYAVAVECGPQLMSTVPRSEVMFSFVIVDAFDSKHLDPTVVSNDGLQLHYRPFVAGSLVGQSKTGAHRGRIE